MPRFRSPWCSQAAATTNAFCPSTPFFPPRPTRLQRTPGLYSCGSVSRKHKKAFAFHYIEKREIVCYILLGGTITGEKQKITSVYIPGLWEDDTQASSTRGRPERSFFFDLCNQDASRRGGCIEDTIVAMLPGHPRDQQRRGC